MYYYVGFCYIMLRRCPDAIHVFVQIFLSVQRRWQRGIVGGLCYIIFSGLFRARPMRNAP